MSSFHSNVRFSFLAFVAGKAAAAAANIALFRKLGPPEVGLYTAALGFAGVFAVIAELGLSAFLVREVSRNKDRAAALFSQAMLVQILQVLAAAAALAVFLLSGGAGSLSPQLVGLAFVWVAMNNLASPFNATLQGLEDFGAASKVSSLCSVLNAVGLGLILLGSPGPVMALASLACTGGIGLGFWAWAARRRGLHFSWPSRFNPFKYWLRSLPYITMAGLNQLYLRLDVVLLAWLSGTVAVGYYGAAMRVSDFLVALVHSFSGPLYPRLTGFAPDLKESSRSLGRNLALAMRYLAALCLPLGLGGSLLSSGLMVWFFGREFEASGPALAWLVWVPALYGLNAPLLFALNALGGIRAMNKILVLNLILSFCLNLLFIPRFGFLAAGPVWVLCEMVTLGACLVLVRRRGVQLPLLKVLWPSLPASLGMAVCLSLLPAVEGKACALRVLEGLAVYALFLGFLGFFGSEERAHLRRFLGLSPV